MSEGSRLYFKACLKKHRHAFQKTTDQRMQVQDVVSVVIKDVHGGQYKIKSWKNMLFIMSWFGFVPIGTQNHLLGQQEGYTDKWDHFPAAGTNFILHLRPDLWNTIAVTFQERGVAKVTHYDKLEYHEDLYALLLACDRHATVIMTFL